MRSRQFVPKWIAEMSSASTADPVPAAFIVMCVTVVAEYVQEQEKIHVATST